MTITIHFLPFASAYTGDWSQPHRLWWPELKGPILRACGRFDEVTFDSSFSNDATMHYMMLIYQSTADWARLSPEEQTRVHDDCAKWHEELERRGHACYARCLQPPATATTVREIRGRPVATDGPFAETKEVLAGFEIFDCANLDEALALAKQFPALRVGSAVEVRPVMTEPLRK